MISQFHCVSIKVSRFTHNASGQLMHIGQMCTFLILAQSLKLNTSLCGCWRLCILDASRVWFGLEGCVLLMVFIILREKPHLKDLLSSWCSGVLICECMSPFKAAFHSLKAIRHICNPPTIKVGLSLLTHLKSSAPFFCLCSLLLSNATAVWTQVWVVSRDEGLMQV